MESQKVDLYLADKAKYLPADKILYVKEKLMALDDEKYALLISQDLKDPTISLILSLFLGSLGIDRFFIGDIGLGVLKLLTCGCCGIFTIVDWFLIMNKTKETNLNKLMLLL